MKAFNHWIYEVINSPTETLSPREQNKLHKKMPKEARYKKKLEKERQAAAWYDKYYFETISQPPPPQPVASAETKTDQKVAGRCNCLNFKTWTLPVNVPVYTSDHECVGIIKYSNEEHDLKYSGGSPTIVIQKRMKASPHINSEEDLNAQFELFMEQHDYEYEAVTMKNTLGNFLKKCDPAGKCISRWTPCSLANAVAQDGAPFPPDTALILTAFELDSKKGHLTTQHKKMGFVEVART